MHVKRQLCLRGCSTIAESGRAKTLPQILLAEVVRFVLSYASPVWAGGLAQRKAQVNSLKTLRICNAFGTIGGEVVLMVTGMIPVDIPAKELSVLYHARSMKGHTERRNTAWSESYDLWQHK